MPQIVAGSALAGAGRRRRSLKTPRWSTSSQRPSCLARCLSLNTAQQLGAALDLAILSAVATARANSLLNAVKGAITRSCRFRAVAARIGGTFFSSLSVSVRALLGLLV